MARFSKCMDKYIWVFLFLSVLILCSLFPYTADDFAWGSESGIKLWKSGFENYSGRYVGNTMVLLLTRSRCLRTLVMTVFIVGLDYMIVKISDCRQYMPLVFIALLFTAPKTVLRESIAWTSGFCIYVTSITMFVFYIYLITCVFSDQILNQRRLSVRAGALFCLGYLSAMIAEHVTIMQIAVGMGIACWAWMKTRKYRILYFFYPIGSALGAVTMFSNGCYAAAAAGTDFYRSIPTGIIGMFEKMSTQYFKIIGKEMLLDNVVLECFAAAVITILWVQKMEEWKDRRQVLEGSVLLIDASVLYGFLTRINAAWSEARGWGEYIDGLANVVFWLALLSFTVFIFVEENKKAKMFISLCGIACTNGCLLFVSPISSRCFVAGYVLLIWYCMECMSLIKLKHELNVVVSRISLLFACLVLYMNLNIYGSLCIQDQRRIEAIRQAAGENREEVVIQRFKYEDYIIGYTREKDFKPFYGIASEVSIKYE